MISIELEDKDLPYPWEKWISEDNEIYYWNPQLNRGRVRKLG